MKGLMPALPESIFDICYLIFMIAVGAQLVRRAGGRKDIRIFGFMCLFLAFGDAFHLVPRVMQYWLAGDFTAALGIGKFMTSITMTLFYLMLEHARRLRYPVRGEGSVLGAVWGLSLLRIALCCFPQNEWTAADPSLTWGILRNIPFVLLGLLTVVLWFRQAKDDKALRLLWLAVTLSFAFYLPVVLLAHVHPMVGMLMLPKTCMYIWIALMFRRAAAEKAAA